MSINTNLIVNHKYTVGNVLTLIKALGVEVIRTEHNLDHSFITIDLNEGSYRRIYVARSNSGDYGGLDVLVLSFAKTDAAIQLFKDMSKVMGGMLQEDDSDNDWTERQPPHEGNAVWVLRNHILKNAVKNGEELCREIKKTLEEPK